MTLFVPSARWRAATSRRSSARRSGDMSSRVVMGRLSCRGLHTARSRQVGPSSFISLLLLSEGSALQPLRRKRGGGAGPLLEVFLGDGAGRQRSRFSAGSKIDRKKVVNGGIFAFFLPASRSGNHLIFREAEMSRLSFPG
jgi:hypothetical protein